MRTRRLVWALVPTVLFSCLPASAPGAAKPVEPADGGLIDLPMFRDPEIAAPATEYTFHPRLKSLWLTALRRPDPELRRQAARAFARADALGMEGLGDIVPELTKLVSDDEDALVRLAAAAALAELDDPTAAATMLEVSQRGDTRDLELTADPALARWKHQPAVAVWQQRIADAARPLAVRVSAARSLGDIGAAGAVETLAGVALDPNAEAALRLAAAEALAKLAKDGLVPQAQSFERGTTLDRLVVARMLAGHTSRDARLLLDRMIVEEGQDPAVVAEAARSLLAIDPAELATRYEVLATHPDPAARLALAQALLQLPTGDRTALYLAPMLDDASVDVRHTAREGILAAAAAGGDVERIVATVLAGGGQVPEDDGGSVGLGTIGWRGIEQAAFIAGKLDHEARADRLIELLRHDRPEVRVAAAQALRQLAVSATLPAMLARAQELAERLPAETPQAQVEAAAEESTQLFMAFGEMNYREADALARQYIPKNSYYPMSRAAAIYALGKFHEGTLDEQLAAQLAGRVSDVNPMDPEMMEVRRFSAVALGRMKAAAHTPMLQRFHQEENASVDVGGATRWALMQITGEELPALQAITARQTGWFLEPQD